MLGLGLGFGFGFCLELYIRVGSREGFLFESKELEDEKTSTDDTCAMRLRRQANQMRGVHMRIGIILHRRTFLPLLHLTFC